LVARGRPKTFENSKALESAMDLFWKNGYEATSLSDLIDVMGISRQSMYNTFGNKHQLFIQCLESYISSQTNQMSELFSSNLHAEEKLSGLFSKMESFFNCSETKGCLVSIVIQEMAQKDEQVKKILDEKYSKNFNSFHIFFAEAMTKGELQSTLTAGELADLLDSILLSVSSLCKLPNRETQIKNLFSIFLKQINFVH
jgi:TetR/AcrR family transcriptional repressor of nem operon